MNNLSFCTNQSNVRGKTCNTLTTQIQEIIWVKVYLVILKQNSKPVFSDLCPCSYFLKSELYRGTHYETLF